MKTTSTHSEDKEFKKKKKAQLLQILNNIIYKDMF